MRFWRPVLLILWINFVVATGVVTWLRDQQTDPYWIAYVKEVDGNMDIYVRPASGGKSWRLTNHPDEDFMPIWSPDGQWIAFETYRERNSRWIQPAIYAIRPNMTDMQHINAVPGYTLDRQVYWRRDGRFIETFSAGSGHVTRAIFEFTNDKFQYVPEITGSIYQFIWTTDERHILALQNYSYKYFQIVDLVHPVRSSEIPLAKFETIYRYIWSRDNRQIMFVAQDLNYEFGLFTIQRDGTNLTLLSNEVSNGSRLALAPNGNWVYYTNNTRDGAFILRSNLSTHETEQILALEGTIRSLDWSPNGDIMIFEHSASHRSVTDLYSANADGSMLRQIGTATTGYGWSPDGQWVVIAEGNSDESLLNIGRIDGSSDRQLTTEIEPIYGPVWSPNGEWIIFRTNDGVTQVNIETLKHETLSTNHPAVDPNTFAHYWSPKANAFNTFDQRGNSPIPLIAVVIGVPIFALISVWRHRSN